MATSTVMPMVTETGMATGMETETETGMATGMGMGMEMGMETGISRCRPAVSRWGRRRGGGWT